MKVTLELDDIFLKKFFGLTDRMIPDDQEITPAMMRKQLDEIENTLTEAQMNAENNSGFPPVAEPAPTPMPAQNLEISDGFSSSIDTSNFPKKKILVIDDLGVITYQLSVLFQNYNYEVTTSKEIYDAIEKFKKQTFDMVIMDLFIPTEREGFILLEELKKISLSKSKPTRIGVMSASSKKEHKQLCKMKGAEFYVEKIDDWQKNICKIVMTLK